MRQRLEDRVVTFVSMFNAKNPKLFNAIRQNMTILLDNIKIREILERNGIIKSKRQPPNLKTLLTRARFDENHQDKNIKKCNRPNCGICQYLLVGNAFSFKRGKTFKGTTNMGCDAKNLIYVMYCSGYGEEYIGETGDSLRHRMTVHRQQIRQTNVRILHVSTDIANCARNYAIKFKLFALYKLKKDRVNDRKMRETYFIELFKPKLNQTI